MDPSGPPAGKRRVAVLRLMYRPHPNFEAVREDLLMHLVEARQRGAQLVVLPALTGLFTLHLYGGDVPTSPEALQEAVWKYGLAAEETLLDWSRMWARELGVYLVPGTCLVPGTDGILHRGYLFSPEGRLLGVQDQTHVRSADAQLGLYAGTELTVWAMSGMRLGLAIGTDAWTPEVGRILALQGATVLVCPTIVRAPQSRWHQLAGPWQQAQGNQVYVVESSLAGSVAGLRLQGRASVIAPVELAADAGGYLADAADDADGAGHGMVFADLDPRDLWRVRREYPIARHFNPALYASAFPRLYWERLAALHMRPRVEGVGS